MFWTPAAFGRKRHAKAPRIDTDQFFAVGEEIVGVEGLSHGLGAVLVDDPQGIWTTILREIGGEPRKKWETDGKEIRNMIPNRYWKMMK